MSQPRNSPPVLTVERMFSSPVLTGNPPTDLKFSPSGEFATFRAPAADDRERYDLFRIDLKTGELTNWLDARDVAPVSTDVTELSDAERADRERRRDFSHGITQYIWRPGHPSELLIPVNGQAYLVDTSVEPRDFRALCPAGTRQSHFNFSPDGEQLSYVRDRDLYILRLADLRERRLTTVESEDVSYGLPDLLAAEEMHRFDGHWWSEDSDGMFFSRVDERPVEISYRLELDAEGARSIPQRYPFAGQPNPIVELLYVPLDANGDVSLEPVLLWQSAAEDEYLARVAPIHGGILIATQDRRQKVLSYQYQDDSQLPSASRWHPVYQERSATWVNLTDDIYALAGEKDNSDESKNEPKILLTHETTGTRQALLTDLLGQQLPLLGPTHINQVLRCEQDKTYVMGWQDTPLENHLFVLSHAGDPPRQLTTARGWHEITINLQGSGFIDRYSDPQTLLAITYVPLNDGESVELHREDVVDPHPYAPYAASHAMPQFGTLDAADGQQLHYKLTPPSQISGRHPVIVYVYGGPGAQKVRRDWGTLTVQLFAQQGFGVLELDNRGSANRGRSFEAPLYQNLGGVEIEDQIAGLSVLTQYDWADTARVGIFGHSYGGYMTLMCMTQWPQHFKAGVAVAPVCDWELYDSHYAERFMDLPQNNPQGYARGNVLEHLAKLDAPLLLMHGMADDNVLFQNTTKIMHRLQELNKKFELMTYPGAKHSMQEPHVAKHRFNLILDFFRVRL